MKLLLAEDDPKLLSHLAARLRGAGHVVDCAQDGSEARWAVETGSYEALVLDIMMPQVDGVTLVRGLRRRGVTAPVIFITARSEVRDRVAGLDAGADDYLVKPFSLAELLARLGALTRRNRGEVNQVTRVADLELDLMARSVRRGTETIELTNRYSNQVAHELRTPLQLMQPQVELNASKMRPELAEALQEELARLSNYVESALTIARAEQGRLELNPEPLELKDFLTDMVEPFGRLAAASQRRLLLHRTNLSLRKTSYFWARLRVPSAGHLGSQNERAVGYEGQTK